MSLLSNFPHTCDITKRSRTRGPLGGDTDVRISVSTGVKCWIQPADDDEVISYERKRISITDKVYFTTDPELTNENFITISGTEYQVMTTAKPDASAGLGVVWRVMVATQPEDD